MINLRGRIVPVIDLHKRFNLAIRKKPSILGIIAVEAAGVTVGMIVDSVSEVLRLPTSNIEPPPPVITNSIDSAFTCCW